MEIESLRDIQDTGEVSITDSFPLMIFKVSLVVMILMIFIIQPFAKYIAETFS